MISQIVFFSKKESLALSVKLHRIHFCDILELALPAFYKNVSKPAFALFRNVNSFAISVKLLQVPEL